jgi:uncharacterized protein YegL
MQLPKIKYFSALALFAFSTLFLPKALAATKVSGILKDTTVGEIRNVPVAFYKKNADGSYTHIEDLDTKTGFFGSFYADIPDQYKSDLENGDIVVKAQSTTGPVKVTPGKGQDPYTTNYIPIANLKGQVTDPKLQGDTVGAFKSTNNIVEVKSFMHTVAYGDTNTDPNIPKDEEMADHWFDFSRKKLDIYYPSDETSFDSPLNPFATDIIRMQSEHSDSGLDYGQRQDGGGDAIAHEFTHMMWSDRYGFVEWKGIQLHLKGDPGVGHIMTRSYNNVLTFQENLAYFYEGAFDGAIDDAAAAAAPERYLTEKREEYKHQIGMYQELVKKWQEAYRAGDTKNMAIYERKYGNAEEKIKELHGNYNDYLKNLQKDPGKIDGLCSNIFWDMYTNNDFGNGSIAFLRKFYKLVDGKQPWTIQEFYKDWVKEYPEDKAKLEKIFAKHGFSDRFEKLEPLEEIKWDDLLGQAEYSTIIIVDGSGSMAGDKIVKAKAQARSIVRKAKFNEEIALIVFHGCGNIEVTKNFTMARKSLYLTIDGITAGGDTPIASSLIKAREYMEKERSVNSKKGRIVLITDGGESCNKNPKDAAAGISSMSFDVAFRVYGYNLTDDDEDELKEIARAGGGRFSSKTVWLKGQTTARIKEQAKQAGAIMGTTAAAVIMAAAMGQAGQIPSTISQFTEMAATKAGPVGEAARILMRDLGRYTGPIKNKVASKAKTTFLKAMERARRMKQKGGSGKGGITSLGGDS